MAYEQRTTAQGMPGYAKGSGSADFTEAQAAANISQAATMLARGFNEGEQRRNALLEKQQDEDARAWSGKAVSEAYPKLSQSLELQKEQAKGGAVDFYGNWKKSFDTYRQEQLQLAPNEKSKKYLEAHLDQLGSRLGEEAINFEAKARVGQRINDHEQATDNMSGAVARNPELYSTSKELLKETTPDVGPAASAKLIEQAGQKLRAAAFSTAIQRDPQAVYQELRSSLNIASRPVAPTGNVTLDSATKNIDPALAPVAQSIFQQESSSGKADTSKPNYAGAQGPMQVMPDTFNGLKKMGLIPPDAKIDDPKDNMNAGMALIQYLGQKYNNDPAKIAAAYYSGEKAVNRDGNIIDYRDPKNPDAPSTLEYVKQVTSRIKPTSDAGVQDALAGAAGEVTPEKTGIPWIDDATVEERLHYLMVSKTAADRNNASLQTGLKEKAQNIDAMTRNGVSPPSSYVPTEREYLQAYGPVDGPVRYQQEVSDPIRIGHAIKIMQNQSPADRAKAIAFTAPTADSPDYVHQSKLHQEMIQANAAIEKALSQDPMSYVQANDTQLQKLRSQFDPSKPETVNAWATRAIAEQQRLGVEDPKLLTPQQADAIGQMFRDPKTGGENSARLIQSLSDQWGQNWPTVYGQLAKSEKLPAAALVIPVIKDRGAQERLARWSMLSKDDWDKTVPADDRKSIETSLLDQSQDFFTAMYHRGANKQYTTFVEQAGVLAKGYRAEGASAGDAAKRAWSEVVGDNYRFYGSYMVPVTESPDKVEKGLSALRYRIPDIPLDVPRSLAGLPQDAAQRAWKSAVKSNLTWVTSDNEDGLVAYAKGQDGGLVKLTQAGRPIFYSWADIRKQSTGTGFAIEDEIQRRRMEQQ